MNDLSSELLTEVIEWDIENWRGSLEFWQRESSLSLRDCYALELGSRNGGLSLWLAKLGNRVMCSDVNGPTPKAREIHSKHKVEHLVDYSAVNATNIPFEDNVFDIVVFKSVLGGIGANNNKEAQVKALSEIHRVLRPGGELLFAENLVGSPLHNLARKKFVKWGSSWRYITIQEMEEFLSPFSYKKYAPYGLLGAFGRTEKQRAIMSKLDKLVLNKTTPKNWKYIIYGVARKEYLH